MKSQKYVIVNGQLYYRDPVGVFLLCLSKEEMTKIINEYHGFSCVGHYSWRATTHQVLKASFYWPTLFFDV